MFLHDLLARVYDTRERRGEGICTLRNFEYGFFVCVRVVRVGCVWSVSVGLCSRPFGCPAHMFSHILLTTMCDAHVYRRVTHIKGVFSPNTLRTCPARPIRAHTCPGITRRLCGWLGASGTQGLRALRLWQSCRQWRAQPWSCMDAAPGCRWQSCRQWRAQPWSCMDAAPGCRLQRRPSANILTAWPGRVAQAPRAGRARAPWSCSPCWRLSSRTARLEDQLGLDARLDDEANSEIANGSDMGSSAARVTSVGDLPASSVSAVQLILQTMCSARTHPYFLLH
jgi:hypothetical protein